MERPTATMAYLLSRRRAIRRKRSPRCGRKPGLAGEGTDYRAGDDRRADG
jgi:hypothetical protein